ncbi:MAG: hypothetical protein ACF8AM_13135, partial [Rhodopirellula sp. JB055]|uniref:hypothetical protein n=1 Tax=Rhodopirellula sp. JB055 TaxID=3342846 RepID=UPI00370A595D
GGFQGAAALMKCEPQQHSGLEVIMGLRQDIVRREKPDDLIGVAAEVSNPGALQRFFGDLFHGTNQDDGERCHEKIRGILSWLAGIAGT